MSLRIPLSSTEYVKVPIKVKEDGVFIDPTGFGVKVAFVAANQAPAAEDWLDAQWETSGSDYLARLLVGPEGQTLAPGSYSVWVQVLGNPEKVVRRSGRLLVS